MPKVRNQRLTCVVPGPNVRPDLVRVWKQKYRFAVNKLGLDEQRAGATADRTIEAIEETERWFGMTVERSPDTNRPNSRR